MIPARTRRHARTELDSLTAFSTGAIIGFATILGDVLVGQGVTGWIVGLAVGATSVFLATVLWSSRLCDQHRDGPTWLQHEPRDLTS